MKKKDEIVLEETALTSSQSTNDSASVEGNFRFILNF
jgi:hypothetical protein